MNETCEEKFMGNQNEKEQKTSNNFHESNSVGISSNKNFRDIINGIYLKPTNNSNNTFSDYHINKTNFYPNYSVIPQNYEKQPQNINNSTNNNSTPNLNFRKGKNKVDYNDQYPTADDDQNLKNQEKNEEKIGKNYFLDEKKSFEIINIVNNKNNELKNIQVNTSNLNFSQLINESNNRKYSDQVTKSYDQQKIHSGNFQNSNENQNFNDQIHSATYRETKNKILAIQNHNFDKTGNFSRPIDQSNEIYLNEDIRFSFDAKRNLNEQKNYLQKMNLSSNNYLDRLKTEIYNINNDINSRKVNHEAREEYISKFFKDYEKKTSTKKYKSITKKEVGNEFTTHFLSKKNIQKKQKSDNYNITSSYDYSFSNKLNSVKNKKLCNALKKNRLESRDSNRKDLNSSNSINRNTTHSSSKSKNYFDQRNNIYLTRNNTNKDYNSKNANSNFEQRSSQGPSYNSNGNIAFNNNSNSNTTGRISQKSSSSLSSRNNCYQNFFKESNWMNNQQNIKKQANVNEKNEPEVLEKNRDSSKINRNVTNVSDIEHSKEKQIEIKAQNKLEFPKKTKQTKLYSNIKLEDSPFRHNYVQTHSGQRLSHFSENQENNEKILQQSLNFNSKNLTLDKRETGGSLSKKNIESKSVKGKSIKLYQQQKIIKELNKKISSKKPNDESYYNPMKNQYKIPNNLKFHNSTQEVDNLNSSTKFKHKDAVFINKSYYNNNDESGREMQVKKSGLGDSPDIRVGDRSSYIVSYDTGNYGITNKYEANKPRISSTKNASTKRKELVKNLTKKANLK